MRKKIIISLLATLTVSNVAFAIPGPVDFAETRATGSAFSSSATIRLTAASLAESELPADASPATPGETPLQSLDADPGELGSAPGSDPGPIDDAIIEPDASPAGNLERPPLRPGDRVLAPLPVAPPPPPDRLTVLPAGAPVLPTVRPIRPADEDR